MLPLPDHRALLDLSGKVVLVTGASAGLGARFAAVVAAAGARTILAARRTDRLDAIAVDIRARGDLAEALAMDVADDESVRTAFDAIAPRGAIADCVIANAGINIAGPALDLAMDDFDRLMAVNLRGAFLTAREAARRLIAADRPGAILLVASIGGQRVLPGVAAYCASKAGVVMLGQALAREWARYRIRVNVLCPGYVETDLNADWFASEPGQRQARSFPARRPMAESALDGTILHLCSDASGATTGAVITIDEGQSL